MKKLIFLLALLLISPAFALTFEIDEKGSVAYGGKLSDEFTSKAGSEWRFAYVNSSLSEKVEIILPEGAVVRSVRTQNEYTIKYRDSFVIALQALNGIDIAITYNIEANGSYIWNLIPFVIALAIIFYVYKKRPGRKSELDAIYSTLNGREKKIIDVIKEKGPLRHAVLSRLTQIPKASLSRITDSLERKGIVKKEVIGIATKVQLIKK